MALALGSVAPEFQGYNAADRASSSGSAPCESSLQPTPSHMESLARACQPRRGTRLAAISGGAFVLMLASVARLRHYDLSWFGWDQAYFLAEARRVAHGDFGVVGPLAAGANIVGPLYSYLLGGMIWIGGDATFVALCNALLELAAVGLVFASARRVSGLAGAVAAAATYASLPILVVSTRVIANPSMLPALSVAGWWLVLRYLHQPTRAGLMGVGLVAGLAPAFHATGVLLSLGWVSAVVLSRPPLRWVWAAAATAALPLLPVLSYLATGRIHAAAAQPLLQVNGLADLRSSVSGIVQLVAAFPLALADDTWPASWSSYAGYAAVLVSAIGILRGVFRPGRNGHVWRGIVATSLLFLAAVSVYTSFLAWYYFMALVGPMCLGLAHGIDALRSRTLRLTVAVLLTVASAVHLAFVWGFDRKTEEAGYLSVDGRGVMLVNVDGHWQQSNATVVHSVPLRRQRALAETLRGLFPGGTTAMRVAHGARAELWQAVGAEFMPADAPSTSAVPWQFVIMGREARPRARGALVGASDVCLFGRADDPAWKANDSDVPPEWHLPGFDDSTWSEVELPRRTVHPSQSGPYLEGIVWNSPKVRLRGRFESGSLPQDLYAVSIHARTQHEVELRVNGIVVPARRHRVLASDISRNDEWLFDLAPAIRPGANLMAIQVSGPAAMFDVDVFRVPCVDADWYY